ncbi:MAG: hypothetical protein IPJ98_09885 [Bryobacterales bacterium]|nr:hypothetical protein [Bryobacterales bacterium]
MKLTWPLLLVTIFVTGALVGQQPPVTNAKLVTAQAQGGLERAVKAAMTKQAGAVWIGWAVKRVPSDGQSCCWGIAAAMAAGWRARR